MIFLYSIELLAYISRDEGANIIILQNGEDILADIWKKKILKT